MSWQKILAQGFASARNLLQYLDLPLTLADDLAEKQFKTRVPLGFAQRMQRGDANDPLLRQVLAVNDEWLHPQGYSQDPLQETSQTQGQGLIHKYKGRVLLILSGACAIHCRYCFRRHFPYEEHNPGRAGWEKTLQYIQEDKSIHEVILSGGDPLLITNASLSHILDNLCAIKHIKTLRFHTRIPIVLPERIDQDLLLILQKITLQKVIVLHSNHPLELNHEVQNVCFSLKEANCELLNQSVLLKGVNDCVETLRQLSERLWECRILPYYLHVLDKVQGASHFDLPETQAKTLFRKLQMELPGYLVPRLAREEPHKPHKQLLI